MSESTNSVRLLLWDEPDIAARLADVMVVPPSTEPAIDLGALFGWLAARCQGDEVPQAKLCTVVTPGDEAAQTVRITAARRSGFGIVVKPGSAGSTADFSGSILSAIERARQAGKVVEVLVASHDADRLGGQLEDLASAGVTVTVLGFREKARYAAASARLGFVDVEDIDGLWNVELPRTNLFDLPEEGRELPPLNPLGGAPAAVQPTTVAAQVPPADAHATTAAAAAAAATAAATSASVLDRVTAGLGQPAPPPPPPPTFRPSTAPAKDIFGATSPSGRIEPDDISDAPDIRNSPRRPRTSWCRPRSVRSSNRSSATSSASGSRSIPPRPARS